MLKGSAFPMEPGMNKVDSGTYDKICGIRCYEEAEVAIVYENGSTGTETFAPGEDMDLSHLKVQSLTINSGLVSLTRRKTA